MLPKLERLRYNGLFLQTYEKGETMHSKNFRVSFTKSLEQFKNRMPLVGFVVGKSFSKSAVLRNRIKRQMREVYRLYRQKPGLAEQLKQIGLLVFSVKRNTGLLSYAEIKREIESLLKKALGAKTLSSLS